MAQSLLVDVRPAVGAHGERGIGRYVRGLAAAMAEFPDDLAERIWAIGYPGPTIEAFRGKGIARVTPHVGLVQTWFTGRHDTNRALRGSGASVLHATNPQEPWTGSADASLVTVYDLIPLLDSALLQSWRFDHRAIYRRYLRQIKSATRLLAISRSTADDLQQHLGIDPARIDIVYPLVSPPPAIRRIEPPEPTFLFVGGIDPHKRPELALDAFGLLRSRVGAGRLRFIGPANPDRERVLRDQATRLGLGGCVSFEGRISDEALEAAFTSATAIVCTSRMEGFGLPPVEAVLRRVPVVAVRTPAALETLGGLASIVPPDPEAIAEAMARPSQPTDSALAALRDRFSIGPVARSLAASYRHLLD